MSLWRMQLTRLASCAQRAHTLLSISKPWSSFCAASSPGFLDGIDAPDANPNGHVAGRDQAANPDNDQDGVEVSEDHVGCMQKDDVYGEGEGPGTESPALRSCPAQGAAGEKGRAANPAGGLTGLEAPAADMQIAAADTRARDGLAAGAPRMDGCAVELSDIDNGSQRSLKDRLGWGAKAAACRTVPRASKSEQGTPRSALAQRLGWIEQSKMHGPQKDNECSVPPNDLDGKRFKQGGREASWRADDRDRSSIEVQKPTAGRGEHQSGVQMVGRKEGQDTYEGQWRWSDGVDGDEEDEIILPDYPSQNSEEEYAPDAPAAPGVELGQHEYMDLERVSQLALDSQQNANFDPHVQGGRLANKISPEQYLEANKHKALELLKMQGMEVTEEMWKEIKEKGAKAFEQWLQHMDMVKSMEDNGLFGNAKAEEKFMEDLVADSVPVDHPQLGQVQETLKSVTNNPEWTFQQKAEYVSDLIKELASQESSPSQ